LHLLRAGQFLIDSLNSKFDLGCIPEQRNRILRNHATILLTGGIVQEYQYDYRIAGVFAVNALERMKDEVR
jgi:hypothetical protein